MPKELPALYLVRLHASEAHCLNTVCSALTFQIEISQFKHKQNAIACHKAALPRRLQWRQQHIKWQSLNNLRSLPLRTRDEDSKKKMTKIPKTRKLVSYLRSVHVVSTGLRSKPASIKNPWNHCPVLTDTYI